MQTISEQYPSCTHLLVVDFEATCGPGVSKGGVEIIEIGAILVPFYEPSLNIETAIQFHQYIRPEIHHQLTKFCKKLTGITQEQVDNGLTFTEGLKALTSFIREQEIQCNKIVFSGWSDFDAKQFKKQCVKINTKCPFKHFLNLQSQFRKSQKDQQNKSLKKALASQDLEFIGSEHSAIDDAFNTARLLPFAGYFTIVDP